MRLSVLNVTLLTVGSIGLAGCGEERIHTVEEYMADAALREAMIARCSNNPGELEKTPNCINARSAAWKIRLEKMS